MRIIFLLISLLIGVAPTFSFGDTFRSEMISSPAAISETGRFALNYYAPLIIDNNESLNLTNFIAYRDVSTKKQILIGAIPGNENLSFICKNPNFLKNEKIADVSIVNDSDIHYFNMDVYRGCIIDFDKDKSAIIIAIPKPFVSQDGDKINHIDLAPIKRTLS